MKLDVQFIVIVRGGTWAHPLRINRRPKGDYYAALGDRGGARLPGSPVIGGFDSFDWLLANAERVHADLEQMRADRRQQP